MYIYVLYTCAIIVLYMCNNSTYIFICIYVYVYMLLYKIAKDSVNFEIDQSIYIFLLFIIRQSRCGVLSVKLGLKKLLKSEKSVPSVPSVTNYMYKYTSIIYVYDLIIQYFEIFTRKSLQGQIARFRTISFSRKTPFEKIGNARFYPTLNPRKQFYRQKCANRACNIYIYI